MDLDYNRLVDDERGLIDRNIYVNSDIYQAELEQVFTRAWLFIGHESMIPNPGDFFASRMGEESVILTRDREHKIHAFLNTCRHRGMKVCRYDQGNTPLFTCPYHAWSYSLDGKLAGVPLANKLYGALDKSEWSLIEVAQLCNYKGAIWATWDPNAPSFIDYLGDAARASRFRARCARRARRRIGSARRHPEIRDSGELEVRRRKYHRRFVSQRQPSFRRPHRHRAERAIGRERPPRQRWIAAHLDQFSAGSRRA